MEKRSACPIYGRLLAAASVLVSFGALPTHASALAVHGSVSATASYSDTYNYLGETREKLSLNLVDAVLNGAHRFDSGLRAGAQLYAYKIGDFNDITLDWASLDYAFSNTLGVRVGRNKIPLGLYNDSQDLDAVRTFASLPLTFYPKSYRAITASMDGVSVYGNVGLGRGGSLDYQLYGGWKESIDGDNPFIGGINNLARYDTCEFKKNVFGGAVFWNTPLEGLRVGYSYMEAPRLVLSGVVSELAQLRGNYRGLGTQVDQAFGAGTWDHSGRFAGTAITSETRTQFHVLSAEYTKNRWLFAAEYKLHDDTKGKLVTPAIGALGLPTTNYFSYYYEQYYGMVTCQATSKLGLGVYYGYENTARKSSGSDPLTHTKDWAATVSYALGDAWVVKAEGHLLNGRSLVWSAGDDNHASGSDDRWTYLVLKSTFSF